MSKVINEACKHTALGIGGAQEAIEAEPRAMKALIVGHELIFYLKEIAVEAKFVLRTRLIDSIEEIVPAIVSDHYRRMIIDQLSYQIC